MSAASLAARAAAALAAGDRGPAPRARAEDYLRAVDLLLAAVTLVAAEREVEARPLRALARLRQLEALPPLRGRERARALRCAASAYTRLGQAAVAAAFSRAARALLEPARPLPRLVTAS